MSVVASANDLHRIYMMGQTEVRALDGMTLDIKEGQMVAVAGPSGSGKTTLLNMFGCLDKPSKGTVIVDGLNVTNMNKKQLANIRNHKIGFIFQSFHLIPVLTAFENVEFTLQIQGNMSASERKERIMPLLETLGIAHLADRRPTEMSGGQQQRVAIARALAKKPKIILADEPTANLDSKTSQAIIDEMVKLNEAGATFVFSTHDNMVMEAAPRLVRVLDGRVVSDEMK